MVMSSLFCWQRTKVIIQRKKVQSKIDLNCIFVAFVKPDFMNEGSNYYYHQHVNVRKSSSPKTCGFFLCLPAGRQVS